MPNPPSPTARDLLDEAIEREARASSGPARLDDTVLEIRGAEAQTFLDSMSATALATIPPGHWREALFTGAQGRVLAWCRLAVAAESCLLAVPGEGTGEELEAHLVRHRLRSRVTIATRGDLAVWGDPRAPARVPATSTGPFVGGDRDPPYGLEPAGIAIRAPEPGEKGDPHALLAWRLQEFREGRVRLPDSLSGAFTVPALGAHAVSMVALHKGCFPGQEVVRKMLRLGHGKRVLAWGEANGSLEAGASLNDEDGQERATVLASLASAERVFVQLIVRLEPGHAAPSLRSPESGTSCRILALMPASSQETG